MAGGEEQRRGRYGVTGIDVTFSARGDAGSQPATQAASPPWASHIQRAPLLFGTRLWRDETDGVSTQFLAHDDDEGNVSDCHSLRGLF